MNIHLLNDEKFTNQFIDDFDRHYPNQNIYFIQVGKTFSGQYKYVKRRQVIPVCLSNKKGIKKVLSYCKDGDRLLIHWLNENKAKITLDILKRFKLSIYWVFYGADLYGLLKRKGLYELHDYLIKNSQTLTQKIKNAVKKIISPKKDYREKFFQKLDYFCFWNPYDYKLLKKHFSTSASFVHFFYPMKGFQEYLPKNYIKQEGVIQVNHAASRNGNHLTILKKIKEVDQVRELKKLYLPLSYGNPVVKKMVLKYANAQLQYCSHPITEFLDINKYYKILNNVSVAFFGQRRQEGGFNIFYLLAAGAKIFLRTDNNLLQYLREKNYHVFEFEKDLNSMKDLEPLAREKQMKNRSLVLKEFSQEAMDATYKNLFNKEKT